MREILFRGKRICENKNWVEGCLVNLDGDSGHVFIVPFFRRASTMPICRIVEYTSHYVDPETVGQFTGLTDKNGTKIFEGDVVRVDGENRWYSDYACRWGEGNLEFELANKKESIGLGYFAPYELEVIGNIHDNPELLEVSE